MKSFVRAGAAFLLVGGILAATPSCSAIVNPDVKPKGLGQQCTANDECHAGICERGLCTAGCVANAECPAPLGCFQGTCATPLRVGALWVGVVAGGEGWTLTHQQGMQEAAKRLPYMSWSFKENIIPFNQSIDKAIDELVKGTPENPPVDAIVVNSFSQRDEALKKADAYPNVKFINCAGYKSNGKNFNSYAAHGEQAWYIAGKVAGMKTKTNLIGYVGSFITAETVRHAIAFYLGAKAVKPQVKMYQQWIGFWSDYKSAPSYTFTDPVLTKGVTENVYREELLTYRLLQDGVDVVGHASDNQRPVRLIERLFKEGIKRDAYSLSNDNNNAYRELTADQLPNGPPLNTCLGSPYWNWGPLYSRIFDEMHRGIWDARVSPNESLIAGADSISGFTPNPSDALALDGSTIRGFVSKTASEPWYAVFAGDYEINGNQRDADGDGRPDETQRVTASSPPMTDEEYTRVCWFPKGVYERINPNEPAGPTGANLRDALVPDAERAKDPVFLADIEGPPGADPGIGINCLENR